MTRSTRFIEFIARVARPYAYHLVLFVPAPMNELRGCVYKTTVIRKPFSSSDHLLYTLACVAGGISRASVFVLVRPLTNPRRLSIPIFSHDQHEDSWSVKLCYHKPAIFLSLAVVHNMCSVAHDDSVRIQIWSSDRREPWTGLSGVETIHLPCYLRFGGANVWFRG